MKGLQLRMLLVAWSVAMVTAAPPLSTATFPVEDGPEDGPGCSKEQYKQRFGALPTYSLTTATTRPAIQSGFVVAKVSYDSLCPGGGSSFTASIKKQANMEIGTILLVLFYLTIYPHSTSPHQRKDTHPSPASLSHGLYTNASRIYTEHNFELILTCANIFHATQERKQSIPSYS